MRPGDGDVERCLQEWYFETTNFDVVVQPWDEMLSNKTSGKEELLLRMNKATTQVLVYQLETILKCSTN